jgi:hypothetical protein
MAGDPEYAAAYRRRRQRETIFSARGRERYMATQRRHNADPARKARKRELALARYYELHPDRPRPFCATCNKPIEFSGRGRPAKYHQTEDCHPYLPPAKRARATAAATGNETRAG